MPAPTSDEIKRLREAGAIDDAQAAVLEKRRADEVAREAQSAEQEIQANMPEEVPAAQAPVAQPQAPVAQPQAPVAQPQGPVAQPQGPVAQPQAPAAANVTPQQVETAVDAAEMATEAPTDPLTEQPIQPQPDLTPEAAQELIDAEEAKLSLGERVLKNASIDPDAELPDWARRQMEDEQKRFGRVIPMDLETRKQLMEARQKRGTGPNQPELIKEAELKKAADEFVKATSEVDKVVDAAERIQETPDLGQIQMQLEQRGVPQESVYNFVNSRFNQLKKENAAIVSQLQQKNAELSEIPEESFWARQETPSKVLFGLATALGAISQVGGSIAGGTDGGASGARALDYVNKVIRQDLEDQRLDRKEQLARYSRAMDLARLKMDQLAREAGNVSTLAKAKELDRQLEMEQMKIDQQRMLVSALSSGKLTDPSMLDEKQRERVVRMPDGTIRLADSKEAATKLREYEASTRPAIDALKRVLVTQAEGSRFDFATRKQIASELQALVGDLRVALTGPGAMTEKELELIKSTIGDPNKLFTLPSWQRTTMVTTLRNLQNKRNTQYEVAGVSPPKDIIQRLAEDIRKKRPDAPQIEINRTIESMLENPEFRKQLMK